MSLQAVPCTFVGDVRVTCMVVNCEIDENGGQFLESAKLNDSVLLRGRTSENTDKKL